MRFLISNSIEKRLFEEFGLGEFLIVPQTEQMLAMLQQEGCRWIDEKELLKDSKARLGVNWKNYGDECRKLKQRQEQLKKLEQNLTLREHALQTRKMELDAREEKLEAQEQFFTREKAAQAAWAQALAEREEQCRLREECCRKQERACEEKARMLQESADKAVEHYREERRFWQNAGPRKENRSAELEHCRETAMHGFRDVKEQFEALRKSLVALNNTVAGECENGVRYLCSLYRDMVFMNDDRADKLGAILQSEFDAVAIEPAPGEDYDPSTCERVHGEQAGIRIACCSARGWKWKDTVLLRALVEVTEEEGKYEQ